MSRLEVVPFSEEHLDGAGALLAARHAHHRTAEPLLAERYEQPDAALKELERASRAEHASGVAGLRAGRLTGYLLGGPRDDNVLWGDNVWVEAAGHAVEEPEDVRDLYGAAAGRWVEEGRPRHYVLVPNHDTELLDAWWRVGFGLQQAHGVRGLPADTEVRLPDAFEIREPKEDEIEQLIDVDLALPEHQRGSPVFGSPRVYTRDDSREEWRRTLAAGRETVLIGAADGLPVACWALVPAEGSRDRGLLRPDRACVLSFAVTLPDFRGGGIGVALTDAAVGWAADQGYAAMVTDWRVTNLLASRFWPRRAFRTTFLRLYRSIP